MDREFTSDWFSMWAKDWETHLKTYIGKDINYLELGSFEGRSLIWMLENILTSQKSTATCIDIWINKTIEKRFLSNILTSSYEKVKILKGYVNFILGDLYHSKKGYYDIIYIDADHSSNSVLRDACMCFEVCKIGGIIIFDDYKWENTNNSPATMKEAIDSFLMCYKGFYEILIQNYQVIIKRIK